MWLPYPMEMIGAGTSVLSIINLGKSSLVSGNTLTLTLTNDAPDGSTIVLITGNHSSSDTIVTPFDSTPSNIYTAVGSVSTQGSLSAQFWYSYNIAGMSAGDKIFMSSTAFGMVNNDCGACALAIVGATLTDPLDVYNSATGNGSTTSVSATTSSNKTVFIGGLVEGFFSGSLYTEASGYTSPPFTITGGNMLVGGAYKTLIAAGANTYNPTLPTTTDWIALAAGFKYR